MDDKQTGTKIRLGEVGYELAETLTLQGNSRAAREALAKPHVGFSLKKTF